MSLGVSSWENLARSPAPPGPGYTLPTSARTPLDPFTQKGQVRVRCGWTDTFDPMMARMGKLAKVFWAVALSLALFPSLASDPSLPKSNELVKKFVQRWQEEDREKLDNKFGFVERRLYDTLDKNGIVKEHSDETFQMVLLDGHAFLRLIAKDAKPLVAEELRKQAERENRFRDEQRRKSEGKK